MECMTVCMCAHILHAHACTCTCTCTSGQTGQAMHNLINIPWQSHYSRPSLIQTLLLSEVQALYHVLIVHLRTNNQRVKFPKHRMTGIGIESTTSILSQQINVVRPTTTTTTTTNQNVRSFPLHQHQPE